MRCLSHVIHHLTYYNDLWITCVVHIYCWHETQRSVVPCISYGRTAYATLPLGHSYCIHDCIMNILREWVENQAFRSVDDPVVSDIVYRWHRYLHVIWMRMPEPGKNYALAKIYLKRTPDGIARSRILLVDLKFSDPNNPWLYITYVLFAGSRTKYVKIELILEIIQDPTYHVWMKVCSLFIYRDRCP